MSFVDFIKKTLYGHGKIRTEGETISGQRASATTKTIGRFNKEIDLIKGVAGQAFMDCGTKFKWLQIQAFQGSGLPEITGRRFESHEFASDFIKRKTMFDLSKIKQTLLEAKVTAKEDAARKAELKREKQQQQEEIEAKRAEMILLQVEQRCLTEAKNQRDHAIIMSIKDKDYKRPNNPGNHYSAIGWNTCRADWLVGTAKLVYNELVKGDLNPTIEYWHDGVGVQSGFNLVAHF